MDRDVSQTARVLEVDRDQVKNWAWIFIERVQVVRSHEVEQLQLADLLIGAVGYANRGLKSNSAKNAPVARMRERSRYSLTRTTLLRESKVNVFIWEPQGL